MKKKLFEVVRKERDKAYESFGFLDFFPILTSAMPRPVSANIAAILATINEASTGCEKSGI